MITLPELRYECVAEWEGGTYTIDSKLASDMVDSLIHAARASCMRMAQAGYDKRFRQKKINDNWLQKYYPDYDANIQSAECYDKDFRIFRVPSLIDLGNWGDGIRYVGSPNELTPLKRLGSGTMKAVYASHRLTNPTKRPDITWDYEGTTEGYGVIKIYNEPQIESILVWGIYANPTLIPTYRIETDPYPISEDMIPMIKQALTPQMARMVGMRADIVADAQDQTNLTPQKTK